ncbi:MAG: PxKF domain-containing protein [Blastocatellia bacterium]
MISTVAADFTTPKASWNLGETAHATVAGAPADRRVAWIAPDGSIVQVSNYFSGSLNDSYAIATGNDPFAQVGTWRVATISPSGSLGAEANFVVRDPAQASVDLSISAYGPFDASSGNNVNYRLELVNRGPDAAANVVVTNPVPAGTTFVSEAQESGAAFTATLPTSGSNTGTVSLTIASLPAGGTAVFSIAFTVTAENGASVTDVANVSSDTNELHEADNSASTTTSLTSSATDCTVSCGGSISQGNDPNQCGAVVTYTTPTASGNCGIDNVVTCNPPSGAFFPIGATAVTCTAQAGDSCSFTVTINDTRPPVNPTINCPADVTANEEFEGAGEAVVNYPPPTTTGNCVNVVCTPPSGSQFRTGTTPVNCTGTDSAHNTVSCSFNVIVNGTGACSLNCSGDVTQTAAAGQCTATVNYSAPTTSGDCGTVACSPASGSTFAVGATVVTCTSSQGGSCDFTVTVNPASAPTITTCASNRSITVSSTTCEGTIPNMTTGVVATGCAVTLSQSPAAGTIVEPGVYTVTITAENGAGEATCTATVTATESTPPVITTCPSGSSASANASCQASVPNVIPGVVATDNCTDPSQLVVTQSPAAGALVGKGVTNIVVTVRDVSGNTATCTVAFTVNDVTPPTISCPANVVVNLPLNSTATSMAVNFTVTAADNCPGVTVASTPASGSVFSVGTTTVNSTATDSSGNTATCSFTVTVLYDFTGFFSPVGNPPVLNTVNAGRSIPVKFSLSGNKGLSIMAAGYPVSGTIACDASAPPNEVTETGTAGSSSLSYDASSDQYVYTWKTEASWAGTCRQLIVKLNDGSTHVANFKFR